MSRLRQQTQSSSVPGLIVLAAIAGLVVWMAGSSEKVDPTPPSPQKGTVAIASKVMADLREGYADAAEKTADDIDSGNITTFSQAHKNWEALNKTALSESFAPLDEINQKYNADEDLPSLGRELRQMAKGFRK